MLLLTDKFEDLCENAVVYLDTNAFIYSTQNTELGDLYAELSNNKSTAFVTLNSVEYEFTRGSRTLQELTDRREYVRNIANILSVNRLIDNEKNDPFSVAMSLVVSSKDSQYTDFLLAIAMHAYKNGLTRQYILSADARAFPLDIFTAKGALTFDTKKTGMMHMNLYALDDTKYAALLKSITN